MSKIQHAEHALQRRYTEYIDTLPGPTWTRIDGFYANAYRRMRVTVRICQYPPGVSDTAGWYFVPCWARELRAYIVTTAGMGIYHENVANTLGAFVERAGLADALTAVCAVTPDFVADYVIEQYGKRRPRLPKWLRDEVELRAQVEPDVEREAR
jgi:hypothetical protein